MTRKVRMHPYFAIYFDYLKLGKFTELVTVLSAARAPEVAAEFAGKPAAVDAA